MQFGTVSGDGEIRDGDDGDDREERIARLPAL